MGLHQFKIFCTAKESIIKMKRELTVWENIFANDTSDEYLISKIYKVWQKSHLLECGWWGNNMGGIIYSFNLNISPKMSYGVLEYDIVMLRITCLQFHNK